MIGEVSQEYKSDKQKDYYIHLPVSWSCHSGYWRLRHLRTTVIFRATPNGTESTATDSGGRSSQ